ncbi:MAG: (d)CMP kinase [Actinomycetota bacterium]|nr:(d)CMP kinase [Actinomycetota bacterium]
MVALDGPAGSGKSTVARRTAQALGWRFVDTGATYRAVTLHVLRSGVPTDDAEAVARVAGEARVALGVDPASPRVWLDGEDVSSEIRGPEVTAAVSAVSAVAAVRARLVLLQRQLMGTQGAVVEGRDIATVVAPDAAVKVYLDAREDVRARRRAAQSVKTLVDGPGSEAASAASRHTDGVRNRNAEQAVQEAIRRRDSLDNQTNKLAVSDGALHLDTSELTLEEVVAVLVARVRDAGLTEDLPSNGLTASPPGAPA